MSGKVTLLMSDQPASRTLARAIVDRGIVLGGIIMETGRPPAKGWKHTLRRALGEELYLRMVSLRWPAEIRQASLAERRLERNAQQTLAAFLGDAEQTLPATRILRTENVNSDEAYQFLQEQAPDLLVVYATGLLRKRTMETATLGAVNAHTALLPDYRGFGAEFWQIYDKAFDKTGITIHFIDEGVDTGDIVYRRHVTVNHSTDPWMLRALNTIQIVRDYPRVIHEVLAGRVTRYPQSVPSTPCFRAKDLTAEHKWALLHELKARQSGSRNGYRRDAVMS